MISGDIGVWIAAILTIFSITYMWKENYAYRFAEYTVVGGGAGYLMAMGFKNIKEIGFEAAAKGNIIRIVPIILGILLFLRFSTKYAWLSRYPYAILVGVGTGIAMKGIIYSMLIEQIKGVIKLPLYVANNLLLTFNNWVIIISVISVITYFLFVFKPKGAAGKAVSGLGTLGRYSMMFYFGSAFATTIAFRFSLIIGRLMFLLFDWLGL